MDISEVYVEARSRWLAEDAPAVPWAVRLAAGVNWSVLVVALAAFGLSAAHTISVFGVVSPGVAFLAPVMIELGLAYAALQAKLNARRGEGVGGTMKALVGLLIVAAFASNLAGGLSSAVVAAGISGLSGSAIVSQFGALPLTVQAGLFIALLMAFIVPAASIVAGEGVASLLFETRRNESDWLQERWREVEREVLYRAVFTRLNGDGLPAPEAARVAKAEVRAYLSPVDQGRALPRQITAGRQVSTVSTVVDRVDSGQATHAVHSRSVDTQPVYTGPTTGPDKTSTIRAYLDTNPEAVQLSINDVHRLVQEHGIEASRALVARILRDYRDQ